MKRTRLLTLIVALLCLGAARDSAAQSGLLWAEVGRQSYTFGDTPVDRTAFGGGLQVVLAGDSSKDSGMLMPFGLEMRSDSQFESADLLSYMDFAFRVRNVAFGPGFNAAYIWRPKLEDPTCTPALMRSAATSCYVGEGAFGDRDLGNFVGMGLSGFAKASFGPQGRAFLQGRYIYYHPSLVYFRSAAEAANEFVGSNELPIPEDFPEFQSGRDLRVSVGYVLGTGTATVLRVTYTERRFNFVNELANVGGLFDQSGRQISVGAGFSF